MSIVQSSNCRYFWFFESHTQVEMRRVDVTRKTKERERSMHQSAVSSTCEIFVKINKTNFPKTGINSQSCLGVLCALQGLSPHTSNTHSRLGRGHYMKPQSEKVCSLLRCQNDQLIFNKVKAGLEFIHTQITSYLQKVRMQVCMALTVLGSKDQC